MQFDLQPCDVGIATLPAVKFTSDDPAKAVAAIEKAAAGPVGDGKFLLGLGGEHSVSIGLTRAVRAKHGRFSLLHVDAHADLRAEYHGSPYNHACAIHAIAEDDTKATIVSIGIRAVSREEVAYAKSRGIHLFPGHVLPENINGSPVTAVAVGGSTRGVRIDLRAGVIPSRRRRAAPGWWDGQLIRDRPHARGRLRRERARPDPEPPPEFLRFRYKMLGCFLEKEIRSGARHPARA
jgi:hypothetical protein